MRIIELDRISRQYARVRMLVRLLRAMACTQAVAYLASFVGLVVHVVGPGLLFGTGFSVSGIAVVFGIFVVGSVLFMAAWLAILNGSRTLAILVLAFVVLAAAGLVLELSELEKASRGAALLLLGASVLNLCLLVAAGVGCVAVIRLRSGRWSDWCFPTVSGLHRRFNPLRQLGLPPGWRTRAGRVVGLLALALLCEGMAFGGYLLIANDAERQVARAPDMSVLVAGGWLVAKLVGAFAFLHLWCAGARRLWERLGHLLIPIAEAAAARDTRPPVLFLRSFRDDHVSLAHAELPWYVRWIDPGAAAETLEELIVRNWRETAPVVAVGRPGETVRPFGAIRRSVSAGEWKETVLGLAEQARTIVLGLADTEGVAWEIEMLVATRYLDKAILVMPPYSPWDRKLILDLGEKLGADLAGVAEAAERDHVVALARDRHGTLVVLTSRRLKELDYELALRGAALLQKPAEQAA